VQIRSSCSQCLDNWKNINISSEEIERRLLDSWRTITSFESIQTWHCEEGHVNHSWLSSPFYDLLYSKALTDLARLDTRSAGLNFFSAWENFVAQTIDLLLQKIEVSSKIPSDLSQSERRLGMYVGLYAAKTLDFPKLPKGETRNIRNKIVHDNMIPSENEVIAAAGDIRSCIMQATQKLDPLHQDYSMGQNAIKRQQEAIARAQITSHPIQFVFLQSQIPHDLVDKIRLIREENSGKTTYADHAL